MGRRAMASKEEYRVQMAKAAADRLLALRAAHSTPPVAAPQAIKGGKKKVVKNGDIVAFPGCEVPEVELLIEPPVQGDLLGEDLESTRYRAECQGTGKRGKHFGARHES